MDSQLRARDLFAGPGGWDLAAHRLGWFVDGYEIDPDTQLTRRANHLWTAGPDVREVDGTDGDYDLEIGSPPCDAFSTSGLLKARKVVETILSAVEQYRLGWPPSYAELERATGIEGAALVLEPLRVLLRSRARAAVWEQVPSVLPIWEACAAVLRERGWSVATGLIYAEQFGVPQIRIRAVLVARRDGAPARLPEPTHSRYYANEPGRRDMGRLPWVSQGRALGLTGGYIGFPRRADRPDPASRITIDGVEYRRRDVRSVDLPALTVTEKARSVSVFPQVGPRRPLSLAEAKRLQTFPESHEFVGSRTSCFLQVAQAVPPVLAEAILRTVLPR